MTRAARTTFPHRRNPDGTFDSICIQCFVTVGTAATEAELKETEITHDCKGFQLGELMYGTERERRPNHSRQSIPVAPQGA
jgi:hypothetical protein